MDCFDVRDWMVVAFFTSIVIAILLLAWAILSRRSTAPAYNPGLRQTAAIYTISLAVFVVIAAANEMIRFGYGLGVSSSYRVTDFAGVFLLSLLSVKTIFYSWAILTRPRGQA